MFLARSSSPESEPLSLRGMRFLEDQTSSVKFYLSYCSLTFHAQVIIGRTDSAQVLGMDEALMRLKLAAAAGADVCFIEGVKTKELLLSTVAALAPKPVSRITYFCVT